MTVVGGRTAEPRQGHCGSIWPVENRPEWRSLVGAARSMRLAVEQGQLVRTPNWRALRAPDVVCGVRLGGFFDGIVFHQILQLHHSCSTLAMATGYESEGLSCSVDTRIDPRRVPPETLTARSHIAHHIAVWSSLPIGIPRCIAANPASPARAHDRIWNV